MKAIALTPTPDDVVAPDATPPNDDGRVVQALWRAGLNDGGLHRLRRLPAVYRQYRAELDGLEADPRTQFARWLAASGRVHAAVEQEPVLQVDALRRSLLSVLARIQTLEARREASALSPAAAAKLALLQQEAIHLRDTLRHVLRQEIPGDPD